MEVTTHKAERRLGLVNDVDWLFPCCIALIGSERSLFKGVSYIHGFDWFLKFVFTAGTMQPHCSFVHVTEPNTFIWIIAVVESFGEVSPFSGRSVSLRGRKQVKQETLLRIEDVLGILHMPRPSRLGAIPWFLPFVQHHNTLNVHIEAHLHHSLALSFSFRYTYLFCFAFAL